MKKAIVLIIIYVVAAIFDWGAGLSFLIRYLLMTLLFLSFLKVDKLEMPDIKLSVGIISSMIIIGSVCYFILVSINKGIAQTALIVSLTPTALASIVMLDILGGNKNHGASNVLITNIIIVVLLPFSMYFFKDSSFYSILKILRSTMITFFAPYLAAYIVRRYLKCFSEFMNNINLGFYAWAMLMYLSVSKSVYFLKYNREYTGETIFALVLIVLVLCIINFYVGKLIGGKKHPLEISLALGHKNNGFGVWFSLTYLNPFIALGPATYVLFQNLYLIFLVSKKAVKKTRL